MAFPPLTINEAVPGDSDIVSQFPSLERTFRNDLEDFLLVGHNTYGYSAHPSLTTAERDSETNWPVGTLIYNETIGQMQMTTSVDPDVWHTPGFASGTRMLFQQTNAPTGWTKDSTATYNEAVICGTTGSVGTAGSVSSETLFARTGTDAVTLVAGNIPTLTAGNFAWAGTAATHTHSFSATTSSNGSHSHDFDNGFEDGEQISPGGNASRGGTELSNQSTSSDGAHTHTVSGTTGASGALTVTMSSMSYTNGSQTTFTPAIDCRVKRFSVIVATKD